MSSTIERTNRLRWRSRRGMRELDQLLNAHLDGLIASNDQAGLDRYEALLACEDDQLWRWLMGRDTPGDELRATIDAIRAHHSN